MVDLSFSEQDDVLTIKFAGHLDAQCSEKAEEDILSHLAGKSYKKIILDAEKLNYVSSSGLRIFLKLAMSQKEKLSVINVKKEVYNVFRMTGITRLIKMECAAA